MMLINGGTEEKTELKTLEKMERVRDEHTASEGRLRKQSQRGEITLVWIFAEKKC